MINPLEKSEKRLHMQKNAKTNESNVIDRYICRQTYRPPLVAVWRLKTTGLTKNVTLTD
jgi:hypothetical protein